MDGIFHQTMRCCRSTHRSALSAGSWVDAVSTTSWFNHRAGPRFLGGTICYCSLKTGTSFEPGTNPPPRRLASFFRVANVDGHEPQLSFGDPSMSSTPGNARQPILDRPRLLSLHNGGELTPTFSHEEMEQRLAKLRGWMQEAEIDSCLLTSIHNVNYFGDYVYCGFGRHYGIVVTHDVHTLISANLDYGRPWRRSFAEHLAYTDCTRATSSSRCGRSVRLAVESELNSTTSPVPHERSLKRRCPARNSLMRARRRCACG